jgi:hypothetical protein
MPKLSKIDMINNCQNLPTNDKKYLINTLEDSTLTSLDICKNLSIFSKKCFFETCNDYTYIRTYENCNIFYIPTYKLFIDEDKKILLFSNINIDLDILFYNCIDSILKFIEETDIYKNIDIGENFIWCQKWFFSYGHFNDELFTLFDFTEKMKATNNEINYFKHLQDYPISEEFVRYLIPNNNANYNKISNYLFGNTFINLGIENQNCYKLKNLLIIRHIFKSTTFHKFPKNAKNHILNKMEPINKETNKNIFITRTEGLHLKRNIENLNEINEFFKNNNYEVINPENMDFDLFVHYLKNAENIYLTWGGIMVCMIYINPNSNIFILKSKSYDSEELSIIKNLISNYSLENNIKVIKHTDNKIDLNQIIL